MKLYRVTYYYLATGMEGRADVRDYGVHAADSADEACRIAAKLRHPNDDPQTLAWIRGCLTAKVERR